MTAAAGTYYYMYTIPKYLPHCRASYSNEYILGMISLLNQDWLCRSKI